MHSGDRGRGGRGRGGQGRSNFDGRSYVESGSHWENGFGGANEGSGFDNMATGFGRDNQGFGQNKTLAGRGRGCRQETRTFRRSGAVNTSSGASFGAPIDSFCAQGNTSSPYESHNWPKSDVVFSSSGFGTPIDDDSFFRRSAPIPPPSTRTQDLAPSRGFGSAAVPSGIFPDERESTGPKDNQNATPWKERKSNFGGFGSAPSDTQKNAEHGNGVVTGFGSADKRTFISINDTCAQSNAAGGGFGGGFNSSTPIAPFGGCIPETPPAKTQSPSDAMFRSGSRNGYGQKDKSRSGFRRDSGGQRRGGSVTASARNSTPPTTGRNSPDENVDPERMALVKKMGQLMNDDGGVYTSDEEDKPPISKKNDCTAKKAAAQVATRYEPPTTHDSPAPAAQDVAQPQKPQDDDDVKQAIADSILLTLLSNQGMRQILKTHSPALFDNMVKHVAVVAQSRNV